jgi:zinc and cadmium transporter
MPLELLFYGLVGSVFSLAGGFLVLWRAELLKSLMIPLLSFAAGVFLGVSFLDLLPEAIEAVAEPHNVFIAFLAGVLFFFTLERVLMRYVHRHSSDTAPHDEHTEPLPALIILGDTLHNFLDGIVIALAYVANPALGLTTTLAIAAHEVPQEIGDFAVLLDQGWSKARILTVNFASAGVALIGIGIGYFAAPFFEGSLPYLLAGVAGIFAYIALSDLIPELHHRAKHIYVYRVLFPFLIGLLLMGYLTTLAHGA